MYNTTETDTGRRISLLLGAFDRGTHRSDFLNKGRKAFQGEQQMLDTGTKEHDATSCLSNLAELDCRVKNGREVRNEARKEGDRICRDFI